MITGIRELSKISIHISHQPWRLVIITGLLAVSVLIIILTSSLLMKVPAGTFTRDPLQILNAPFYTGILSNIGILFWCAAAVICLFSFYLLPGSDKSRLLFFAGLLTLFFLFDDFFLFHEVIYRNYLHLPQKLVFSLYIIALAALLFRFWNIILETEFIILFLAIIFFLISGIVDAFPKNILPFHHLFEDGPKFIGIIFWFMYYLRTSLFFLKESKVKSP